VVAEDCVASDDPVQHDASLLLMRHRFDIATSDEIGAIWSATGPVGAAHAAHTGSDSTH
jgi:hypothetical protein